MKRAFVLLLLVAGCDKSPEGPAPAPSASAAPVKNYAAMTAEQRLEAASALCFVEDSCDPASTAALLDAAAGDVERADLEKAARAAMSKELQTHLAKKHKSVVKVSVVDNSLHIEGVCNKFVLENVLASAGRHGRKLGLAMVDCSDKSLQAKAPIP